MSKQMIVKATGLLVDVLEEFDVAGIPRFRVRDSKNKKAEIRTFLGFALRPVTEEDVEHIVYLYTDDETGEVHTLKLQKEFIAAIPAQLGIGSLTAKTTASILETMSKVDTDSARRQFRGAVAYWIERGVVIVANSNGYFIAESSTEVDHCVKSKERQAQANLKRAALLRSMDITKSLSLFQAGLGKSTV